MRHGTHRRRARAFSVKFYLVAMVFILFDVEAIFLYPWAYIYKDMFKISYSFGPLWLRRDAGLHCHPVSRVHLSLEKGRVSTGLNSRASGISETVAENSNQNTNVVVERLRSWSPNAISEVIEFAAKPPSLFLAKSYARLPSDVAWTKTCNLIC